MRATVMYGAGDVRIANVPIPRASASRSGAAAPAIDD